MYGLRVVTGPTAEPVTLEEASAHCRVDTSDEETLLAAYITAARQYAEEITGRAFLAQTLELTIDTFPAWEIELPRAPVASITSISYLDTAGAPQTVATYVLDGRSRPPRLTPAYGASWPEARGTVGSVAIRFVAGEASAPEPVKQAILLMVGHWFEHREDAIAAPGITIASIPLGANVLLAPYRIW